MPIGQSDRINPLIEGPSSMGMLSWQLEPSSIADKGHSFLNNIIYQTFHSSSSTKTRKE